MTHSIRINALEHIRDKAQRDIDEIERQIAEEERPRVGDTVQIVPPHGYPWWAGEAVVISDRHDGLGLWLKFKTGSSAWFEYHRIKVVSRAAPKSRRWYTQTEFIAFMFAHPVIVVRNIKDGAYMFIGQYALSSDSHSISAYRLHVADDNFKEKEFSTDGKTWQSFGVEV